MSPGGCEDSTGGPARAALQNDRLLLDHLRGRRVAILTFGCTANEGDSAALAAVLALRGATVVGDTGSADAVVVNTCAVVAATERRMLRVIRTHSGKEVFVTGCLPASRPGVLSTVGDPPVISHRAIEEEYHLLPPDSLPPCAVVRIAEGCLGCCTYCITRRARGQLRSRPAWEVAGDVRRAAASGIAEIRLTAQDCAAWGADTASTLPALMEEVLPVPGDHMLRLGMMHPASVIPILPGLARVLLHERVFRFVHLPVQSGSDRILTAMRRGYSVGDIHRIVSFLREEVPGLALATDIICGFPGETDADVEETIQLLREVRFSRVNITRYSRRPGTPAAALPDMPERFKKDRSRRIGTAAKEVTLALNAGWIGRAVPVIVTEKIRPGSVMARTRSYQGVVIPGELPVGTVGAAQITGDRVSYFTGTLVRVSAPPSDVCP